MVFFFPGEFDYLSFFGASCVQFRLSNRRVPLFLPLFWALHCSRCVPLEKVFLPPRRLTLPARLCGQFSFHHTPPLGRVTVSSRIFFLPFLPCWFLFVTPPLLLSILLEVPFRSHVCLTPPPSPPPNISLTCRAFLFFFVVRDSTASCLPHRLRTSILRPFFRYLFLYLLPSSAPGALLFPCTVQDMRRPRSLRPPVPPFPNLSPPVVVLLSGRVFVFLLATFDF